MVTRPASSEEDGRLILVVNGERKDVDYAHIAARLPDDVRLEIENDYALIALQGPKAAAVMSKVCPEAVELPFMGAEKTSLGGLNCHVTRSGYTGEDGFEISFDAGDVEEAARLLLANPSVQPIGLGARDTLRLEAGLCLYGHDIDETTSPIEADLAWSIAKRRREQGGFPGTDRVRRELRDGSSRKRVGFRLSGRAPAREGCIVQSLSGEPIGKITSGTFAPSLGTPISMGYVTASHAVPETTVNIVIRETPYSADVTAFPFVPNRYHRTSS
jgi:aminomethyltransferase